MSHDVHGEGHPADCQCSWCVVPPSARGFEAVQGLMVKDRDDWLFTDYYGQVWRLKVTHDRGMPLTMEREG